MPRLIEIYYFLDARFFSKFKAYQKGSDGSAIIDAMDQKAAALFDGKPFLYVTNKDRKSQILEKASGAKKMEVLSHGLNCYDGYHNIYFSAALNREPRHLGMLRDLGFDLGFVHEATTHEVIYQAVMRTSLRIPNATNPVIIIVPDRQAAIKLQDLIGATTIMKLGNIERPKPRPLTAAERKRRLKVTKQIQALFAAKREQNLFIDINCTLIAAKPHPLSNSPTCIVTFHQSKYAKKEDEFIVVSCSIQDLIAQFRLYAGTLIAKKEQVFFNPAHFDPTIDPSQGYRTQANFHSASMLVLDFDKGALSPDRFVEIFWTKAGMAGKRSFIICNTFSRSPEEPNRFRVILFFKTPALTLSAYEAVFDSVIERIVEEGYPIEEMGIDTTCRSGVQSFYIPCTNRACPDHAFFEQHGTETRDIARYGIDPSSYEKTAPVPPKLERVRQSSIGADVPSTLTPELSEMQAELRAMPRGQNDGFFTFGCNTAVHFKGDESKITQALLEAAGSDRKLQAKIKSVLTSLKNYGLI